MWLKTLGLRTYFILKHRFLTATIFTSFASTMHKSLKIILCFRCCLGYDICLLMLRIPFLEVLILLQWNPEVKDNDSSEFLGLVETSQNWRECVISLVSLQHPITCNKGQPVMLPGNKRGPHVLRDWNVTLKYLVCLKNQSILGLQWSHQNFN